MLQGAIRNPNISTAGTHGLLRVISPDGLRKMEQEERQKSQEYQDTPPITELASNLRKRWSAALRSKQGEIDERLLKCRRARSGEYDPNILAEIKKFGGSSVYMLLTSVKCRAAAAWIRDVLVPPGEKPWSIDPTPLPDLPETDEAEIAEEVVQETYALMAAQGIGSVKVENVTNRIQELLAKRSDEKFKQAKVASQRFEKKIDDEFHQGRFYKTLIEFIDDLVTYPTAFICGPETRRRKVMAWKQEGESGAWNPEVAYSLVREYRRVSPFDIYPAPSSKSIKDGYLFERQRVRRKDLLAMIGVPGFNEFSIRQVLRDYGKGYREMVGIDQERANLESRPHEWDDPDPTIDALCYWGSVQGKELIEWGMSTKQIQDPLQEYEVNCWLIGRYCICARLNPHPLGNNPYHAASYETVADSVWGTCPPELMKDVQRICNGIARAIVNNAGVASGPQVEINKDRMAPGQDYESVYPWKIWQTKDDKFGHGKPAIQFFQPNPMTDSLLSIYQYFFDQASEQVGIPAYMYGNEKVGGGGSTATGLSMLMSNASKAMKAVITNVDENVIKEIVKEHWVQIMLYDDDEMKTGDINVVARASEYLLMQESYQLRRLEFLERTMNPIDLEIIKKKGRATILREVAKSLKLPSGNVVPSEDEMEAEELALQQAAQGTPPGGVPGEPPVGPTGEPQPGAVPQGAIHRPEAIGPGGQRPGEQVRRAA